MRSLIQLIIATVLAVALAYGIVAVWSPFVANPDPNHAHADFAVWIGGTQLDFSDAKYMSSPPAESASSSFIAIPRAFAHGDDDDGHVVPGREYLHLHDGNGHLIHRHKPGLTLGDFFNSIGFRVISVKQGEWCWVTESADNPPVRCESGPLRLFVNGVESGVENPFDYVFADADRLLLTDAAYDADIARELSLLTDDACLYSKTCPWRGEPPAEGCVADPAVPCTDTSIRP